MVGWRRLQQLQRQEIRNGVLETDGLQADLGRDQAVQQKYPIGFVKINQYKDQRIRRDSLLSPIRLMPPVITGLFLFIHRVMGTGLVPLVQPSFLNS